VSAVNLSLMVTTVGGGAVVLAPELVKKYKRRRKMEFLLQFDGSLLVRFKPHEVEAQIEFLSSIEPTSDEDSEIVSNLLQMVIENKKGQRNKS